MNKEAISPNTSKMSIKITSYSFIAILISSRKSSNVLSILKTKVSSKKLNSILELPLKKTTSKNINSNNSKDWRIYIQMRQARATKTICLKNLHSCLESQLIRTKSAPIIDFSTIDAVALDLKNWKQVSRPISCKTTSSMNSNYKDRATMNMKNHTSRFRKISSRTMEYRAIKKDFVSILELIMQKCSNFVLISSRDRKNLYKKYVRIWSRDIKRWKRFWRTKNKP